MGPGAAWAEACGYGRLVESSSVFFTAKALEHQEAIGGNAQRGVMVEATPVAPLVVAQAQFGLQLLVVALDHPTAFGIRH